MVPPVDVKTYKCETLSSSDFDHCNIFLYHLYFWERVNGHWTLTIASNSNQIITIAIIDFNRYWVATLFSQFGHIVRCINAVVCNVLSSQN